uniref:Putative salivary toxin-like peptide n=1 Tax=Nyssomyia neivai TaxID=330878 RepID=A0A1L8DP55_9DIPT
MDSKFIILCFIIAAIVAIYATPSSLAEDHSASRSKRATCKYLFGWCGDGSKCCKYLTCATFNACWWNGQTYIDTLRIDRQN